MDVHELFFTYKDGTPYMLYHENNNGELHGISLYWHMNGKLGYEAYYVKNNREGEEIDYYLHFFIEK